jgi:GT2 family glycosyltransferase
MKKLIIIISSNRIKTLPKETVNVINKTKTPTILIKQKLPPHYTNHAFITEIHSTESGVSRARNLGIKFAIKNNADILAFTDDDCIITPDWINTIKHKLSENSSQLLFGKTLPYQPKLHPNQFCPCTFFPTNLSPITTTSVPRDHFGYGNNFAISVETQKKIGYFNPLLGVGTRVGGGEDDDYFIRAIQHKITLYHQPTMLLFHNKWLPLKQKNQLNYQYTFSFAHVYGWYSRHWDWGCFSSMIRELKNSILQPFTYLRYFTNPKRCLELIYEQNKNTFYFILGLLHSLLIY